MPQHITVSKFNSMWDKQFDNEKELIKTILADNVAEIYHIGSTAVKGLSAKPIIDIMAVVYNLSEADFIAGEFEKIGYEYLGEFGISGRRYLRKGGDERTHHIHIFQYGDKFNIERHLAVRDYLRTHPNEARQYGELKERLAALFPYDIDGYCEGKEQFVKKLERDAVVWYENTIRQANICETDEIMRIWKNENIRAHNFIPPDYWEQNYAAVKNILPHAEVYVYTCKGEILGFAGLNGSHIEGIFVDNGKQRIGIGSKLLTEIKAIKSVLNLNVYRKNANAVRFYLKNNFEIIDETTDEFTGEKDYVMEWKKHELKIDPTLKCAL